MLPPVRPLSLVIGALVFVTAPVATQSSDWTDYLNDPSREEAQTAVRIVERAVDETTSAGSLRYAAIEASYVSARDSLVSHAEYREALRALGVGEPSPDGPERQARQAIAELFRDEPPLPGTPTASLALAWLSKLAESESFPVDGFRAIVSTVERDHLDPISAAEAQRFSEYITVTHARSRESLTPQERAREDFATWTMGVLAAETNDRFDLVRSLGRLLERWSPADTRAVRGEIESLVRAELERAALAELLEPSAGALAAVSAHLFAEAARCPAAHADAEALGELLMTLTRLDPEAVLQLDSPELTFLVDTTDALLSSSSDLQRFMLAQAMGLSRLDLPAIHHRLRLLRARAARLPRELDGLSGRRSAPGGEYQRFLAEGRTLVAAAREWAEGERSRSGEAYRWAVLPIVSHPYSQYLLATDPALDVTAAMVDSFVSQVYSAAFRRAVSVVPSAVPITVGDGVLPFHRVYRVRDREAAIALYDAFTAEALGVAELSREFLRDHAAGLTMAGYWSHLHGLHLVYASDDGPEARIRARTDDWFALARAADTAAEELSLLVRGLLSVRRAMIDEIRFLGLSSESPAIVLGAPRLALVLSLLDEVAAFDADPVDVMERIGLLYETRTIAETVDRVAAELGGLVRRERDVVIADRRVLAAATEARP